MALKKILGASRAKAATAPEAPARTIEDVKGLMGRYWYPQCADDNAVLPEIFRVLRGLDLSKDQLRVLRIWLRGGTGMAGERRADLRELVSGLIEEKG